MKKFLIGGVSLFAILSAVNANAAGYTCEELVEYTSCNPGYYLSTTTTDNRCPDGYTVADTEYTTFCYISEHAPENNYDISVEQCEETCASITDGAEYEGNCVNGVGYKFYDASEVCVRLESMYGELQVESTDRWTDDTFIELTGNLTSTAQCNECPEGYSCEGGTAVATPCVAGTYQPSKKQASCIEAPAGNYVAGAGATAYTACAAGSYQPNTKQTSCVTCPAGSYCGTTGLSAVSGECAIGSYAGAGADACTSCPSAGLTDINGVVVNATTLSAGAESISACVIGPDVKFKDDAGTYHFKSNCEYKVSTFKEACTEYQKTDASIDCDVEFDIDEFYYCDNEYGRLIYDPETGGIGCHTEDGGNEGPCAMEDLDEIKSHCELTNGTYDPLTTQCICPAGMSMLCDLYDVDGEWWDGLGCKSVEW